LKNSQLHRNRDLRDHFLRFRDTRDQVFKKGTLGDLRDQVAALCIENKVNILPVNQLMSKFVKRPLNRVLRGTCYYELA